MSTTDGVYLWYFGGGKEPETYHGRAPDRETALREGWGMYPEGDFTLVEADKAKPTFDTIDADQVLERFEECNEECWREDGAEINPTTDQKRELEKALGEALEIWMDRHNLHGRAWSLGHTRNEEYFPPSPAVVLQHLGGEK